jgi:hypothetical protein
MGFLCPNRGESQNASVKSRYKKFRNIKFEKVWADWGDLYEKNQKETLYHLIQLDEATQTEKWVLEGFKKNLLLASLAYELNLSKNYSSSPLIAGQSLLDSFRESLSTNDIFNLEQSLDLVRFDVSKER